MILYLDTTNKYFYFAIYNDSTLLVNIRKKLDNDLSSQALTIISKAFSDDNISLDSIAKIIVVNGPGSFTGTRIGVTIAKVLAWSLKVPMITLSSLELMSNEEAEYPIKVPIIDARRSNCYSAIYDGTKVLLKEAFRSIESLKSELSNYTDYVFITNDDLDLEPKIEFNPDIKTIIEKYKDKEPTNLNDVDCNYLKKSEAEEKYE